MIKDKNIFLKASLFDEKIKFNGEGHLDDTLPWKAEVEIQPGRYDFLLGSIFADIPEDVSGNLRDHAEMEGNSEEFIRKHRPIVKMVDGRFIDDVLIKRLLALKPKKFFLLYRTPWTLPS